MVKQKFSYLCFFSFSFLTLEQSNASSFIEGAKISLQNDGLIYLVPGNTRAYTPKNEFQNEKSAGFTGELKKFNEFFITLNDKNGDSINDNNLLDLISIRLDYEKNSSFLEACKNIKFGNYNNNIYITKLPNQIYTLTKCHFKVKSKNIKKLNFSKNEINFQLKLNYSYDEWIKLSSTISFANSLPSVKFAQEIEKMKLADHNFLKKKEISFESPTLFETLDLSSIYNLDIFPHLEKLKIDGYRIHPAYANSFAFPKATQLKELVFTRNIIPTLPSSSFHILENLEKIWLVGNRIESIQSSAFDGLNKLDELNLDYNQLEQLQNDSFYNLNNLTKLTLSNSRIKNLSSNSLKGLTNLKTLDLKNNLISNLNESSVLFANTPNLNELNLKYNNIENISNETFSSLEKLEKLYLSNNKIQSPLLFGNLLNLKYLDLSKNNIDKIQDSSFIYLTNLNEVILSENEISNISNIAFKNNNMLTKIDLRSNHITEIPQTNSIYLKNFLLSGNEISAFNYRDFENAPNIENLEISYNNISNIAEYALSNLQSLTSLDLGNNKITTLSLNSGNTCQSLLDLPNLNSLWLNNNNLNKIQKCDFDKLTNLKFLAVSDNPIQTIASLEKLTGINEIWISPLQKDLFSTQKLNTIIINK